MKSFNHRTRFWVTVVLMVWAVPCLTNTIEVEHASVSSRSIVASEAGVAVMKLGGNAVDAAAATAFALAVTHPSAGNLGGGGFMVIRMPDGQVYTNDHREVAPAKATRDMFLDDDGNYVADRALRSHLSSGVPGSVAGVLDVHERFGRLTRKQVIARAIELARDGFELPEDIARQFASRYERFSKIPSTRKIFYKPDGSMYEAGDLFVQSDLANTLQRISDNGKSGFYTGATADLIVAEMQRGGGLITHEDLLAYRSVWREPIRSTYRGYTVHSMPPPSSGGVLIAQLLNMLEPHDLRSMGVHTGESMHVMVESERRAYADRAMHLGDPDFYEVPVTSLIDKKYAIGRSADIGSIASDSEAIGAGTVAEESTETTHFSVIDADGMAIAFTTTINGAYGSGIVVEGTGFLLNNEMDDFSAKPGVPNMFGLLGDQANAIEPKKRMLSSMTPTIVSRGDDFILVTGSPGGSTIITTTLQVVVNVIDHQMSIQDAVGMPRFHHQWKPNTIRFEAGIPNAGIRALEKRGHVGIQRLSKRSKIGDANSILKRGGTITATSDPRNAGGAAGF